ncbi:MAG: HD domain-containing phosphohydrolase [Pseudomonadota bacterium]|nr:HD domain-containing protein [Pseudomonadota bacterium]MBU1570888.1 HD domain-containing protein [Pseudomonadota bacterium]
MKKLQILNLEDNPNDSELNKEMLEDGGIECEITRVETEDEFRAACDKGGFDIILADYNLPTYDGLSALEVALERCPDLPFIFVSGRMGEEVAIESLKSGATDYILKNNFNRLASSVLRALKEAEMRTKRKEAEEQLKENFERLKKSMSGIIQAIALTVETRDPYTSGHQIRVAKLAMMIAGEMNLSPDQTEGIKMAAEIHDIGKLSVPAEILSKPSKLSDIEFQLIKIHPDAGYKIIKDIEFSWPIAEIIVQHHERIDGSGYPKGLKGEEILLDARILAVADVVEAIASHRPYRPAYGIDIAIEEISKNKGILYDTDVVDACLKLFNEKGFMFE